MLVRVPVVVGTGALRDRLGDEAWKSEERMR